MARPFAHSDTGTSARQWDAVVNAAPPLVLPPASRALVVSPHPDDESLGAGGLIARLARAGACVTILSLTDGEKASGTPDLDLAALRRAELETAMRCLGSAGGIEIVRTGLPDGGLAQQPGLDSVLAASLRCVDLCIGPWWDDGHADHDATGRSLSRLCAILNIPYLAYPIWAWHWARPGSDTVFGGAHRVELDGSELAAKRRALGCFVTQTGGADPILRPGFLGHFERPFETFLS